ncbi:MAG: glucose 1-dehydrogenase [Rhodospirillaceae bacterium]|nr:glucose 1-dehydrogenase [Rhodospirillaceae bacterium]MCY4238594.1 glucose 1-dehydrogenase [Rhodospirillaceae bacterium]
MANPFDLADRTALVTGASSGLGRHFGLTLAAAGAKVAVTARRTDLLASVAEEALVSGGMAVPIGMDVTDPDNVRAAIAEAEAELGSVDILVNNAGTVITEPALDVTEDNWNAVISTNLTGAWNVAQEIARTAIANSRSASIINIASITGIRAAGHIAAYAATKSALLHLTRVLALEWARYDIRVNALAPGYIRTDLNEDFFTSPAGQRMIDRIPQRRLGEQRELNGALLLLASDASSYMTGSVIQIDGGHLQSTL